VSAQVAASQEGLSAMIEFMIHYLYQGPDFDNLRIFFKLPIKRPRNPGK
jgi:hypothetical protein